MKKNVIIGLLIVVVLASCQKSEKHTGYANPFVGAAQFGHCMPCATTPLGMIQVGPESGNNTWDYTSGYQYTDSILYGFSHNRLSGTGCPDLGDLLFFPYSGTWSDTIFSSHITKSREQAVPGYYSVYLDDAKVLTEMSATPHTAIHHYTYDNSKEARLMIDFQSGICWSKEHFGKRVNEATQNFESPTMITGQANVTVWVNRNYYYAIEFSTPYKVEKKLPLRDASEKASRYILKFDLPENGELYIKTSISKTSIEGAKKNLAQEMPKFDLNTTRETALNQWEDLMNRIQIDGTPEQKNIFYTSVYHLFIHPNNIADVDENPLYSTLSLWDTYRAAHPLYTILLPEKINDFVNSMLAIADKQGFLPIWSLWGLENYCMIGNHSVPVIVDAYLKGFAGFDVNRAYETIKHTLTTPLPKTNWKWYDQYGYYPFDSVKTESVSRTLECCYDDWCAAQMAKKLGKENDYKFFANRSNFYKNLFDPTNNLMRGKDSNGNWRNPFNVLHNSHDGSVGGDYTEGNAWQYTWHVQHDIPGLISLFKDTDTFTEKLDSLFTLDLKAENAETALDVTGLIGQYAHGNEPSHHVAYLYALAGKKWRTEELVREICTTQYHDKVDGLCGNDDCGQMSAWYIFTCLGFYPVNPCGGTYVLGAPQIPAATISLPEGKIFKMKAENLSDKNLYVKNIEWNGKPYTETYITHQMVMGGGELIFHMTDKPSK